jgi:hypothetical protein
MISVYLFFSALEFLLSIILPINIKNAPKHHCILTLSLKMKIPKIPVDIIFAAEFKIVTLIVLSVLPRASVKVFHIKIFARIVKMM